MTEPIKNQFVAWKRIAIPGIILLGGVLFYQPLFELAKLSMRNPLYSHVPLIPIVSAYLIWVNRASLLSQMGSAPVTGLGMLSISGWLGILSRYYLDISNPDDLLFVAIAGMLIWLIGGFILVCGWRCFRKAIFPLLFMGFMLPIPSVVLDPVVWFLQMGSVEATQSLLNLSNVPNHRDGILISLPGLTVKVAKQCSGIRSAVALLVLCTAASYVFLKSNVRRIILIVAMVPVTILKNGMRIGTLTLMGSYVDIGYITDSALHSAGGKPFFVVAVIMMSPILWVLRRTEAKANTKALSKAEEDGIALGSAKLTKDTPVVS